MLEITRIERQVLASEPFKWAFVDKLYSFGNAAALAASFPRDNFKTVSGHDGEKGYEYVARSLVHLGADTCTLVDHLSPAWKELAADLLSPAYRSAVGKLTGCDLSNAPMEINAIHYGTGAWMGPHLDLREKIVTHVLYFNESWKPQNGGHINILNSSNPSDVFAEVMPIVGNSVVLVRSDNSWHSVSRVSENCRNSRRSVNVIFHLPGSRSTMWPDNETPILSNYVGK
jgi:Rps23 Pro-64 3,4-dihydroxylase Tpa1-like proline 4-hydroxylase